MGPDSWGLEKGEEHCPAENYDQLLEELVQYQHSPELESVSEKSGEASSSRELLLASGYAALAVAAKEGVRSTSPNVYSELPAPVEASLNSNKDLDSILDDLLALGPATPPSSSAPPPLAPKLSVKKKSYNGFQDNDSTATGAKVTGPTPSRKTDAIDDLLGGLSSDLAKIGVRTTAKGHCASCGKLITGKMITALGSTWHPEHFACAKCETELGTGGFFERDGRAYCEKDYQELFSPRCAYCNGAILQNILTALDQNWHPDHFFCAHCGDRFGPEGFLEKDGKPYCNKDFYRLFAPKCSGCGESVRQNYLNAANGTWHPECFVCADCRKPFTDGCFMEMDGRPLCSLHFHTRQGTLCGSCGEPITGRCISALDRKFHPEHFVCAFCLRQLSQGVFKEEKQKPYCSACHSRLFE